MLHTAPFLPLDLEQGSNHHPIAGKGNKIMSFAEKILQGLGGKENVSQIVPCITRLRVEVSDPQKVDAKALQDSGAFGVVTTGSIVQVVVGPQAEELAQQLDSL